MKRFANSKPWSRVLIAGGGFAALETLLALRALGEDWARVDLVAPDDVFTYRPAAIAQAFNPSEAREYDLRAIAEDLGAHYHQAPRVTGTSSCPPPSGWSTTSSCSQSGHAPAPASPAR
jgi:hypothetical protein